jgi:dihydroneopterin aldolase
MTPDHRHAFGHPEERAAATAGAKPLDRISVRDYVVEVEIGAFAQERGHLQHVRFNIVVEVLPAQTPLDDDVDRILSYDRLTEAVQIELHSERINLLETLAERVAQRILQERQAVRVFVRIEKIDRGPYDLGVEIVRARQGQMQAVTAPGPRPRVAFLADAGRDLGALIAALGTDAPLILTVGAASLALPQTVDADARRRIELLSMEQNAWAVAGRDARCFVVSTRTELDWAAKNGQISVWAPSRMVTDAVPPPQGDALALAVWFAEGMGAVELVVIGAAAPQSRVPVRMLEG